jgi:hypothetical protein
MILRSRTKSAEVFYFYLRTFSKRNWNIMYGVYCDILSKYGASHMNARALLIEWQESKRNGGGKAVDRTSHNYSEVQLEIWKCVRNIKRVAAWIRNGTACIRDYVEADGTVHDVYKHLHTNESRLFCFGLRNHMLRAFILHAIHSLYGN